MKREPTISEARAAREAESIPLVPLNGRILLRRDESPTATDRGILLPDQSKRPMARGTVLAVGPGKWNPAGTARMTPIVKPGDTVVFSSYAPELQGNDFTFDGVDYFALQEDDILAMQRREE